MQNRGCVKANQNHSGSLGSRTRPGLCRGFFGDGVSQPIGPNDGGRVDECKTGRHEWRHNAGWYVVAGLANAANDIDVEWFRSFLTMIENEIADAPNWTRYSMNNALIAIGGRNDASLRDAALAVSKRIGKVQVDHGDTSCKTPDAAPYIKKMWDRRKTKKA